VDEDGVRIREYVERPDDFQAGAENSADVDTAESGDEAGWLEDGEFEGVAT
jgi:hypothetical protein